MKFTFKTEKAKGQWRAFSNDDIIIKLNKKECGNIDCRKPFKIRLQVLKKDILEDGNKNCKWRWITLKHESESVQDAKDWLNNNIEMITQQLTIWNGD